MNLDRNNMVAPPPGWDRIVGIHLNGCIDPGAGCVTPRMRSSAHAHTGNDDPMQGWVCVNSGVPVGKTVPIDHPLFTQVLVKPILLMVHEYAHLRVGPRMGHNSVWRGCYEGLAAEMGMNMPSCDTLRRGDMVQIADYARPARLRGMIGRVVHTHPRRAELYFPDAPNEYYVLWPYDLIEPFQ